MTSRKSNWKGLGMSFLLLCVILGICNCSASFNNYPDRRTYTGEIYSSAIKISSDNRFVMVGYNSGNVRIFYTSGSLYTTCYGHNSSIIEIE